MHALSIFRLLKGREQKLSCSKFAKLYKFLKRDDFQMTQYELLFKRITIKNGDKANAFMDFELFVEALSELSQIWYGGGKVMKKTGKEENTVKFIEICS